MGVDAVEVRRALDAAWHPAGYTSPNPQTYPWQWLWDSCFHAIIWSRLGEPDRAVTELTSALSIQGDDGFVPHMNYGVDPAASESYWGRTGASTITQPPMYGHAIRVLVEAGVAVPPYLVEQARRGLTHLFEHRRRAEHDGLLVVVHPWETGCDDSARWGSWMPEPFDKQAWDETKTDLVSSAEIVDGGARSNPSFEVPSVAFNALVAFNARELAAVGGGAEVAADADTIAATLGRRWSPAATTWTDGDHASATAPTVEALLPTLVVDDGEQLDTAFALLDDSATFAGAYGLRQTSAQAPSYEPDGYWRGATWPQLDYLLALAARRSGRLTLADRLATRTSAGAAASGLAEYWNPETGEGRGAIPQSWSGLGISGN